MQTYVFKGDIYPKEVVKIPTVKTGFSSSDLDLLGNLTYTKGVESDVEVILELESYSGSIGNLKNSIQAFVSAILDSSNYFNGTALEIRLFECIGPDNTVYNFHTGSDILRKSTSERPLPPKDIITQLHKSVQLIYALMNYRKALKYAEDRGFYSYRCIESIMQHFKSWEILRKQLNIDRPIIDFIKPFSDATRHGNTVSITDTDNNQILNITAHIIDRFVVYLNNDSKLDKRRYRLFKKL
jgi:hypothetical protein